MCVCVCVCVCVAFSVNNNIRCALIVLFYMKGVIGLDAALQHKLDPTHIAACAVEKTWKSMLCTMKPASGRKGAGMMNAFWAMIRAVANMSDNDDFLAKVHCEPSAVISTFEKPESVSVDKLGDSLAHFIPNFLSDEPGSLDKPPEL